MKTQPLSISRSLWDNLLSELRRRGNGERESGGFMLAKIGSREVTSFICYDDLDEAALATGIITFHASGFVKLWNYCQEHRLFVVADVHTHPSDWTGQSASDRTHPMVAMPGHVALILPDYAASNPLPLNGASVYEYKGSHKWKTHTPNSAVFSIKHL
jgi:proteasome lid subunit RPN8/RPN11